MLKVGDKIERNLGLVIEPDEELVGGDVVEALLFTTVGGYPGAVGVKVRGIAMAVRFELEWDFDHGASEIARSFYWHIRSKALKGVDREEDCVRIVDQIEDLAVRLQAFLESGVVDGFIESMRPLQPAELQHVHHDLFDDEAYRQVEEARAAFDVRLSNISF